MAVHLKNECKPIIIFDVFSVVVTAVAVVVLVIVIVLLLSLHTILKSFAWHTTELSSLTYNLRLPVCRLADFPFISCHLRA